MGTLISGIRTWTEEQDQFIRDNRDTMTHREMGERLGRTRNAVIGRNNRLDLGGKGHVPRQRTPKQKQEGKSQIMKIKRRAVQAAAVGTALARTSMDERSGGMGWFKEVPAVEIALDEPDIETRPVSLVDRRSDQCCWPLDDGNFCGMPVCDSGQGAYCRRHHALSVRPQAEYRRNAYPIRRR